MLELPEIEVIRERLRLSLVGRRIISIDAVERRALVTRRIPPAALVGTHLSSIIRRGRLLVFETDAGTAFCARLGRTGLYSLRPNAAPVSPRAVLGFTTAEAGLDIIEGGRRLRVELAIADNLNNLPWLGRTGLDPLDPAFTLTALRSRLSRCDCTLRLALSDNHVIAGLGDAFADEVLFEARLSPFEPSALLGPAEAIRLHLAIKKTVSSALVRYRTLPASTLPDETHRDFLRVHQRAGQPCQVCGTQIRTVREGSLTSFYCPTCQTHGIELADRNAPLH